MARLSWDFNYLVSYHVTRSPMVGWNFSFAEATLRAPITFSDVQRIRAEAAIELDVPVENVIIIAVSRMGA